MTKNTLIGEGVMFQSICRVTGYLSDYSRINDAKQEEIRQRTDNSMKHAEYTGTKAA
jgi:hypothetical protein